MAVSMPNFGNRQPVTYLFIDGGYLRENYARNVRSWFGSDGEIDFRALIQMFAAKKSFYYDCLDEIARTGESKEDLAKRIEVQQVEFDRIREIYGSHVRLGKLTGNEKRRRQKEVDILLAVDMMNHAFRRNMEKVILLSGDRDFKPVVESLVEMGMHIEVASDPQTTCKEYAFAADHWFKLHFNHYHEISSKPLKDAFARPGGYSHGNRPKESSIIAKGESAINRVTLYQLPSVVAAFVEPNDGGSTSALEFANLSRLKQYLEILYGEIVWR